MLKNKRYKRYKIIKKWIKTDYEVINTISQLVVEYFPMEEKTIASQCTTERGLLESVRGRTGTFAIKMMKLP